MLKPTSAAPRTRADPRPGVPEAEKRRLSSLACSAGAAALSAVRSRRAAGAATAVTSRETLLAPWLPAACRVTIEGAICDQWTMLHTAMKTMARAAKIKGPFERR